MQEKKSAWMKVFSERLKLGMAGHKQSAISREIGVGQPNLSMYLKGESKPSLDVFRALCVSLRLNANWLLGLSDTNTAGSSQVVTATGGSAASGTGNATVHAAQATTPTETSRLLGIIESQQRVIETLSKK